MCYRTFRTYLNVLVLHLHSKLYSRLAAAPKTEPCVVVVLPNEKAIETITKLNYKP